MPKQTAVPIEDVEVAEGWVNENDETEDLFESVVSTGDTSFIRSPESPDHTQAVVFRLSSLEDPEVLIGHISRIRFRKSGVSAISPRIDARVEIRQAYVDPDHEGTLIQQLNYPDVGVDFATQQSLLTNVRDAVTAITDYEDLFIKISGEQV